MDMLSNHDMIEHALKVFNPRPLDLGNSAGTVGCALLSASGRLYYGVCIDIGSGIGFCAEHAAVAAMITAGETRVAKIVAVSEGSVVLPPCGRCRELLYEIDRGNLDFTEVVLGEHTSVRLNELLPHPYHEVWNR
jgi:cytidine deaminase